MQGLKNDGSTDLSIATVEPPTIAGTPAGAGRNGSTDLGRILGMRMPISVTLAERDMPLEMILEMTVGTIIEFDVPVSTDLSLLVANRRIGSGHAVKCGENFGLRVTKIGSVYQRIGAMGGR